MPRQIAKKRTLSKKGNKKHDNPSCRHLQYYLAYGCLKFSILTSPSDFEFPAYDTTPYNYFQSAKFWYAVYYITKTRNVNCFSVTFVLLLCFCCASVVLVTASWGGYPWASYVGLPG